MQTNKQKKTSIIINILTVILALSCFTFQLGYRVAARPGAATEEAIWEPGTQVGEASYVIWREGSTYYARNGTTGAVQYSGTNFTLIVNNALTYASVFLKSGTYELQGAACNIKVPSNRIFQGEDAHTTLIQLTGNAYVSMVVNDQWGTVASPWLGTGTNENITIRNLSFDGSGTDPNKADASIQMRGVENLLIENIIAYNCTNLSFGYVEDGCLRNIILYEHSCSIAGNRLGVGHTNNSVIENVWIYGSTKEGMYIGECSFNNTFTNNYIFKCSDSGIELKTECAFNTIIGNTLIDNTNNIWVSGQNNVVANNKIYGGTNAIVVDYASKYNTISGNTIYAQANSKGIMVQNSGTEYNTISSNSLYDCGYGIRILNTGNNTIIGNTLYSCNYGITLHNATWNVVTGNIANNGVDGIWEWSTGTSDYNLIIGCTALQNSGVNIGKIGANSEVHDCFNGTTYIT